MSVDLDFLHIVWSCCSCWVASIIKRREKLLDILWMLDTWVVASVYSYVLLYLLSLWSQRCCSLRQVCRVLSLIFKLMRICFGKILIDCTSILVLLIALIAYFWSVTSSLLSSSVRSRFLFNSLKLEINCKLGLLLINCLFHDVSLNGTKRIFIGNIKSSLLISSRAIKHNLAFGSVSRSWGIYRWSSNLSILLKWIDSWNIRLSVLGWLFDRIFDWSLLRSSSGWSRNLLYFTIWWVSFSSSVWVHLLLMNGWF